MKRRQIARLIALITVTVFVLTGLTVFAEEVWEVVPILSVEVKSVSDTEDEQDSLSDIQAETDIPEDDMSGIEEPEQTETDAVEEDFSDVSEPVLPEEDISEEEVPDAENEPDIPDEVPISEPRERAEKEDVINILLIGTDERTKGFSENARGDTCMLFSINKKDGVIRIISFERALGIPMHDGPYKGKTEWLTHLFRYGGAKLMKNELSLNFGLNIDCYVRVNIRTFVALIDAIGGIDMELTSSECGYINGSGNYSAREIGAGKDVIHVKEGLNHLNGATAMVYARCRKIDSDWKRVERQRKVIIAAMEQLAHSDLSRLASVVMELMPLVETDVGAAKFIELVGLVPNFVNAKTEQLTVPEKGKYTSEKGMGGHSVYAVDFESYSADLDRFLYGG